MTHALAQKRIQRMRRKSRVRAKIRGTSERPRLSVFRSNTYVWAQLIDDDFGTTLVSANDKGLVIKKKGVGNPRCVSAESVGALIAEKAKEKNIQKAVFDRSGYDYHGIVKAVAEGARKGGLLF